jgi:hypothetical protein
MQKVLAIDPGPEESAWVMLCADRSVGEFDIQTNDRIEDSILSAAYPLQSHPTAMAIEMIDSFGMAVGKSVFETIYHIGRLCATWQQTINDEVYRITRRDIKLHLCNSSRAKDANVRQVLIDRYGGTRQKAVGTKKNPGPLYGFKTHLWSALAVGITYLEKHQAAEIAVS